MVPATSLVGEPGHHAAHRRDPLGAGREHLVEPGVGVVVDRHRVGGLVVLGVEDASRPVGRRLAEHRPQHPGVGAEDEVAQGLEERPLVVHALAQHRLRQRPGPREGRLPGLHHHVPGGPEPVGVGGVEERPTGVSPLELGLDERPDVDAVDRQPVDEAVDVHVLEPDPPQARVGEGHVAQEHPVEVDLLEPRPAQIDPLEAGSGQVLVAVLHHRPSIAPPADRRGGRGAVIRPRPRPTHRAGSQEGLSEQAAQEQGGAGGRGHAPLSVRALQNAFSRPRTVTPGVPCAEGRGPRPGGPARAGGLPSSRSTPGSSGHWSSSSTVPCCASADASSARSSRCSCSRRGARSRWSDSSTGYGARRPESAPPPRSRSTSRPSGGCSPTPAHRDSSSASVRATGSPSRPAPATSTACGHGRTRRAWPVSAATRSPPRPRCARPPTSGAARRWPTSSPSRSPRSKQRSTTSCGPPCWRTAWRPTSPAAGTPSSSPSSRQRWGRLPCGSGCGAR